MNSIDLNALAVRESEQVEWKFNVADIDDVVATLTAFANDWSNLGGGYVVCGAQEIKDPHGFQRLEVIGLSSARLKEVENKVLATCRERVSPEIAPLVEELPTEDPTKRVLIFVMPATRSAHLFRRPGDTGKHYVRLGRETREARNGILRELLVRKGVVEDWDKRPARSASVEDLDLLALRDCLQRMGVFRSDHGTEEYLSDSKALSPFVPPLCVREPLTNVLRPRNFAVLLFGRNTQLHIPGAFCVFSIYPGVDRSEPHAERNEIAGTLIEQARRLIELLDVQSYVAFDKTDRASPNAVKYPPQALHEAMMNALAHRDYELADPVRATAFVDRIEIVSPGSLPTGITLQELQSGEAAPKWRNQTLAWFLSRLQLAQAEGQGIPTILRAMKEEGCPPPKFVANEARVICLLPAHPRHALAREYRLVEDAISVGDFEKADRLVRALLDKDPMNLRTMQLFAEVQRDLRSPHGVRELLRRLSSRISDLPPSLLTLLAEVLTATGGSQEDLDLGRELYLTASKGRMAERDVRQVALGLSKAGDDPAALRFLEEQFKEHPEFGSNAGLLRIRGNVRIGVAKLCTQTGKNRSLPYATKSRAWEDCRKFLQSAEQDLRRAISLETDPAFVEAVQRSLDFVEQMKKVATPPGRRRKTSYR